MNAFSLKRFGLLLRREIIENGRPVLLAMITLFGFSLIVFLLNQQNGQSQTNGFNAFIGFYLITYIALGLLVVGMAFPDFRNKGRATTLLAIPATNFEKWLSSFLLTSIGFFIVFHIGALIFYYTTVLLVGHGFTFKSGAIRSFKDMTLIFLFLHSLFFLGATMFKRIPVLFSGLILIIFFLLFSATIEIFESSFMGTKYMLDLQDFNFRLQSMEYGQFNLSYFSPYIWYVFPIILWATSYFKFKEKEIA